MYWICISLNPQYFQLRTEDNLEDFFLEIFGDDYIEHCLLNCEETEKDFDIDKYIFINCKEYENHINNLRTNRFIKNVLNSFSDVVTIPEEEIFEIKSSTQTIIDDDDYCVNRSGFFLFGDIVRVLRGSLSSMHGVVIKQSEDNPDMYLVYFRLFVHKFYKEVHISNMEFHSSIFKYIKVPVQKGEVTKSTKRIKRMIKEYNKLLKENSQKKLIGNNKDEELDVAEIMFYNK